MIWQDIQNGAIIGNTTAATDAGNNSAKTESKMDETKEMFLKLLVAEMQYQDPLQPTDNSEYVKELSQFTQVETLNSVNDEVTKLSVNTMVGKYVSITDEDTGKVIEGKVDYVQTDSAEPMVSVNGNLYKASQITSVAEGDYFEAIAMADSVTAMIDNLPTARKVTLSDANQIAAVKSTYDSLSDESKSRVPAEAVQKLEEVVAQILTLQKNQEEIDARNAEARAAEEAAKAAEVSEVSEETAGTVPEGDEAIEAGAVTPEEVNEEPEAEGETEEDIPTTIVE